MARYGVFVLDMIDCIKASSGTDDDVNKAIGKAVSDYYNAVGEAFGSMEDARAKVAGAAAKGMGGVWSNFGDLVAAIDGARDDPDDLYLSMSNDPDRDHAFWPGPGDDRDLRSTQSTGSMRGTRRIVPYVFGIDSQDFDVKDIVFWEYDSGSGDDHLGRLRLSLDEIGTDAQAEKSKIRVKAVLSDKNGGSIYVVYYRAVPITIPAQLAPMVLHNPMMQMMGGGGRVGYAMLNKHIKKELAALGIR